LVAGRRPIKNTSKATTNTSYPTVDALEGFVRTANIDIADGNRPFARLYDRIALISPNPGPSGKKITMDLPDAIYR
jgi:hypothetical protein